MKKFLLVIFSLISFLLISKPVFAEQIRTFDVQVDASKDGNMRIYENINYDFENLDKHGIYRYIPLYTKVGDLYRIINIKDVEIKRDGENEKFTKSQNKHQIYLKIGDPDKTITGAHIYEISYVVENGIGSNFPDFDEIYWNATGNGWDVPINSATIKISSVFGVDADKYVCFTGAFGTNESDCSISDGVISSNRILSPNEGLTGVAVFPKGTYPPSILSKSPPETFADKIFGIIFDNILYIWIGINVFLTGIIIYWYQKHKNKKRFGKPVVNFHIPKDEKGKVIAPALAGTIDSAKLERDDVLGTMFDLAIRKYIKFEAIKKERKLLPDSEDQKIIKLKDSDKSFTAFEKTIFDRLFKDGDEVLTSDLKKSFYKTFRKVEKEVFEDLVSKKYFVKNPKTQKTGLIFLSFIALFTANFILAGALFYLSRKLIGRTELGDEIDFKIDGLKIFLKGMDRNYNWQAQNFYTVEQMIPYAMSLGYIDKFMEQLKIIKPDYNPVWYSGYRGSFYLAYAGLNSSLNSNITTASPSSSGSGGGGFSGGGGGGGGGGSW